MSNDVPIGVDDTKILDDCGSSLDSFLYVKRTSDRPDGESNKTAAEEERETSDSDETGDRMKEDEEKSICKGPYSF